MNKKWWKEAIVYQIYTRSFYDSNADGIGDLKGILQKLDYLKHLGIDVIWLCPVYESPNDDNGYDISNYYGVMSEFGTIEDLETLFSEVHKRDMKIIMDLVINHTSDEHKWFVESRADINSDKRDYYIWRKAKDGSEPNNWKSYFGGPAWEYDRNTDEYYLHLFSKKQPDLNWSNPEVKEEIFKMMVWWLDKGIDGFRMDVINLLSKPEGLGDSERAVTPADRFVFDEDLYANQPGIHEILQEMNKNVLSRYDCMTVGETVNVTVDTGLLYTEESRNELDMIFQFELMGIDTGKGGKWDVIDWKLTDFVSILSKWQKELHGKGWNSLFLNNHDNPRAVSRFGDDGLYREKSAKMLATLTHTLEGTPYIYQGEEIGMTNVAFQSIDDYRDIETLNFYKEKVFEGNMDEKEIMQLIHKRGRDNARTPMQWDSSRNAGFTSVTPWIKVNSNYKFINVESNIKDENSILNFYRKLIKLRKENPVLIYGEYIPLLENSTGTISYIRKLEDDCVMIIMNFSNESSQFDINSIPEHQEEELLLSNYASCDFNISEAFVLMPYEARVYRLH
ncbi:MAG: glycosidase [Eubacterium sp.]|jgi:oligo-1,6-glucosidase|nr:glycosidase [Eubacterium sp.]